MGNTVIGNISGIDLSCLFCCPHVHPLLAVAITQQYHSKGDECRLGTCAFAVLPLLCVHTALVSYGTFVMIPYTLSRGGRGQVEMIIGIESPQLSNLSAPPSESKRYGSQQRAKTTSTLQVHSPMWYARSTCHVVEEALLLLVFDQRSTFSSS